MSDVLFELTEDNLETGLRGVPVGYCPTSYVDAKKGLHYAGLSLSEIYTMQPEEVIYLLYHGKKPKEQELKYFSQEIQERQLLSSQIIDAIEKIPVDGESMDLF